MRLLLVYPGNPSIGDSNRADTRRMPAIGLPVIANVTPPDWEIEYIDEEGGERVNFDEHYDLVGITSMTSQAPRAYAIADEFRRRGVPVVHGGSHPTVCPEEALEHGDAVVAGEGEQAWPVLLKDFTTLRELPHRVYRHPLDRRAPWYVPPKRSLIKTNTYPVVPMVATRGCPFACSFCSVFSVFGRGYRHRPVDEVVAEVRALRDLGHKNFVFLDDNIMGSPKWSKELFRALAPLDIRWGGQAHLAAARDPELMSLAKQAGLFALFIGIESVNRAALESVRKGINDIDSYRRWVDVFHEHGVFIFAGIIFGFDEDDPSVFSRTVEVLDKLDVAVANFSLLVPLPGTDVHQRLTEQGRIFDTNWAHYDGSHVVYLPAKMSPEELHAGSDWAAWAYFTPSRIIRRFGANWRNPLFYWTMSLAYAYKEHTHHGGGWARLLSRAERRETLSGFGLQ